MFTSHTLLGFLLYLSPFFSISKHQYIGIHVHAVEAWCIFSIVLLLLLHPLQVKSISIAFLYIVSHLPICQKMFHILYIRNDSVTSHKQPTTHTYICMHTPTYRGSTNYIYMSFRHVSLNMIDKGCFRFLLSFSCCQEEADDVDQGYKKKTVQV